jgi:YD repeat-containing protein
VIATVASSLLAFCRVTGSASTDSNGITTFHDRSGFVTGRAQTDVNGTATFYDAAGRVTGKRVALRPPSNQIGAAEHR